MFLQHMVVVHTVKLQHIWMTGSSRIETSSSLASRRITQPHAVGAQFMHSKKMSAAAGAAALQVAMLDQPLEMLPVQSSDMTGDSVSLVLPVQ